MEVGIGLRLETFGKVGETVGRRFVAENDLRLKMVRLQHRYLQRWIENQYGELEFNDHQNI